MDWVHSSSSSADLTYRYEVARALAPHTQGQTQSYTYQAACIGWPAPVANPQHPLASDIQEAPPILLANAVHDPETSLYWALGLEEQIPSAVLVIREGDGHGSYHLGGETAFAIERYLITGEIPAPSTVYQT